MQVLINGLISGLTISLLALAFSAVYVPTRVFHISLAAVYVAAPYLMWACMQRGWSVVPAASVAVAGCCTLSLLLELASHWRLQRMGAAPGAHLIASLGAYIVLTQAVTMIWGPDPKTLRRVPDIEVIHGHVAITQAQAVTAGVCVGALVLFYAWLHLTGLGLRFRAMAENPDEFALRGFNVRAVRLVAFGVSGLLGAAVSLAVANDIGFDPNGGLDALLTAVVAVIIGGRLSLAGPMLGGILLGVIQAEVVWRWSAIWQQPIAFLLLAVFLFFRPNGIIGYRARLEAEP